MNTKLEDKLRIYEESIPITSDEELLKALEDIIAEEDSRPVEERDLELIDEALDALFALRGTDTAVLDSRADEIADKRIEEARTHVSDAKHKKVNSRILFKIIPIAAVVSMFIFTALAAGAAEYDLFSEAFDWIRSKIGGNADISTTGSFNEYATIDELISDGQYSSTLLPTDLPDSITVTKVTVQTSFVEKSKGNVEVYSSVDVRMLADDALQTLSIETDMTKFTADDDVEKIGGHDVVLSIENKIHKGSFIYEGNVYTVSASSYENLKLIICSLQVQE